eukprot:1149633-Pelagomonas_calceolata.AAC.8
MSNNQPAVSPSQTRVNQALGALQQAGSAGASSKCEGCGSFDQLSHLLNTGSTKCLERSAWIGNAALNASKARGRCSLDKLHRQP